MKKLGMSAALAVILVLLLAACGGNGDGNGNGNGATNGAVNNEAAERGRQLAQSNCLTCHTTDGRTLVGPTWKGLYGSQVTLEDGSTVEADEEYLRESIVDPNAKVVKGFPPSMPPFGTLFDDQQIADIVEYIKTLQ